MATILSRAIKPQAGDRYSTASQILL